LVSYSFERWVVKFNHGLLNLPLPTGRQANPSFAKRGRELFPLCKRGMEGDSENGN